ncbi:hypothetical protein C7Y70_08075 [Pseudoalteromonas sp. KS88]|nr:hypothetical protein C7Y70_08075 [Pseudoalteromonas sp. KS88]
MMAENKHIYTLVLIYFYSMLIPMEAFFYLGSIRMELYRLILICITPFVLVNLRKQNLFGLTEKFLLLYCAWVTVSFLANHGTANLESGVINFLEVFIGYGLGLLLCGSKDSLKKLFKTFLLVFTLLIPLAIIEASNGIRVLHIWAANIFGNPVLEYLGDSYFRYGLHRASTVFSHPILYSICALMVLPLSFLYYKPLKALLMSTGLFVAMISSVTSAGFLMVIMQFSLFVLKRIAEYFENIYKVIVWGISIIYLLLIVSSNRGPVLVMVESLALNPATAYARYQQWQFSADDIANSPLFGIGFESWSRPFWMSDSVDSFWLNVTLVSGYPALFFLTAFFFLTLKAQWQNKDHKTDGKFYFVFFCSTASIVFAGLTVDFFDRAQLMVFLMLGIYNSFLIKPKLTKGIKNAKW